MTPTSRPAAGRPDPNGAPRDGGTDRKSSPRREELLDRAYRYALEHGLADLSLRPLAAAIGTSPRVLLFLFGSKDELLRELLARARADELAFLAHAGSGRGDLATVIRLTWQWLRAPRVRPLLTLWTEAYARSLVEPDGPWAGFAAQTVADWLEVLARAQAGGAAQAEGAADDEDDEDARAERTLALAVLRGCFLDLLATGDADRVTAALDRYLSLSAPGADDRSASGASG